MTKKINYTVLGNLTDEEIDEQFTNVIREKMTDKEFWEWASGWLDIDEILDQAENWDTADKIDTLTQYYADKKTTKK